MIQAICIPKHNESLQLAFACSKHTFFCCSPAKRNPTQLMQSNTHQFWKLFDCMPKIKESEFRWVSSCVYLIGEGTIKLIYFSLFLFLVLFCLSFNDYSTCLIDKIAWISHTNYILTDWFHPMFPLLSPNKCVFNNNRVQLFISLNFTKYFFMVYINVYVIQWKLFILIGK